MGKKYKGSEMLLRNGGQGYSYVKMMRSGNVKDAIVYVEGVSDIKFYKWLIDNNHVKLEPMKGKTAAMEAVQNANNCNTRGGMAIVDSDFDHIFNIGPDQNVIRTDTHDIETLMFSQDAFKVSRDQYVDESKLSNSVYDSDALWNRVIEIAKQVGKIRLLSQENNWKMKFSSGGINDRDNLEKDVIKMKDGEIIFDDHQFIYECIKSADNCNIKVSEAFNVYKDDDREFDVWQICRGHDVSLLTSMIYSKAFFGVINIERKHVEVDINSSYINSRKFKKSQMFSEIKKWQLENKGWKILSDELT